MQNPVDGGPAGGVAEAEGVSDPAGKVFLVIGGIEASLCIVVG